MRNADRWVLKELKGLGFKPYAKALPQIALGFQSLRGVEEVFREVVGNRLTKRQAVAYGLLARSFQLSISCLVNQLHQNHSGWNCSYRALLESFFVVDWVLQKPLRLDAYFESRAPGIGRIKADCCRRHPAFSGRYDFASQVTHVETRALLLSRNQDIKNPEELPFTATTMDVGGSELALMLCLFAETQALLAPALRELLLEHRDVLEGGEALWDHGMSEAKFGCLGWVPR